MYRSIRENCTTRRAFLKVGRKLKNKMRMVRFMRYFIMLKSETGIDINNGDSFTSSCREVKGQRVFSEFRGKTIYLHESSYLADSFFRRKMIRFGGVKYQQQYIHIDFFSFRRFAVNYRKLIGGREESILIELRCFRGKIQPSFSS